MPTDRAQDTEAIRAALERLVAQDSFEAPYADAARAELARLVARLEAAEPALEFYADVTNWTQPTSWGGRIHDDESAAIADCGKRARAALAAAAPGETPLDVLACPECGKPLQLGHDCLAGSASAAPGETGQTP